MAKYLIKNGSDGLGGVVEIKCPFGPWDSWSGTGTDNATFGYDVDHIGFDGAGDMYDFTAYNNAWIPNGLTKAEFMGSA